MAEVASTSDRMLMHYFKDKVEMVMLYRAKQTAELESIKSAIS